MIRGTPLFDGVAVGELEANFIGSTKLSAKAGFVNAKTGQTHGFTTHTDWSQATLEKLAELRASMEVDIAKKHFSDVESVEVTSARPGLDLGKGGLGEHLGQGTDPPSV